jgi:hypothetical protein
VELVVPVAVFRAVTPARLAALEVWPRRLFVRVTWFTLLDEERTIWECTCWEHAWGHTFWVNTRSRAAGTRDLLLEAMPRILRRGQGRRIRRQICRGRGRIAQLAVQASRDSLEPEARAARVHLLDGEAVVSSLNVNAAVAEPARDHRVDDHQVLVPRHGDAAHGAEVVGTCQRVALAYAPFVGWSVSTTSIALTRVALTCLVRHHPFLGYSVSINRSRPVRLSPIYFGAFSLILIQPPKMSKRHQLQRAFMGTATRALRTVEWPHSS